MSAIKATVSEHETDNSTLASYATGFILSLLLTIIAYMAVTNHGLKRWGLVSVLIGLAVIQLFVQMIFFLHLAQRSKPRWNLMTFGLMLTVVLILVGGSLWIMYNLSYRMMPKTPQQINTYIQNQGGGV